MTQLRWGIMGTGGIAAAMAGALQDAGSPIVAVGSARPGAAGEFAAEWDIPQAVLSHRAVAEEADVDVVYVATTNDRHLENVLDCIEHGKPVLCEKPIAMNARQAHQMFDAAHRARVFVMEAMWMRFLPFLAKVDDLIADGAIGTVRHVEAAFSYPATVDISRRWIKRELGGGALLDLGVYPLSLIHHLLGPPISSEAEGDLGETSVDMTTIVMAKHAGGTTSRAASSFVKEMTTEAVVSGDDGLIRIHPPFHHSPLVTVERQGEVLASYDTSYQGHGFQFEIAEVHRCLTEGLTESPIRPHQDTLAVMEWMDATRAQCGVIYPPDK